MTSTPLDALLEGEEWKPVPFRPVYLVSNLGRVWSIPRERVNGRILKIHHNRFRYGQVQFWEDGKAKHYLVHRLVLEAFRGPAPAGYEAAHLDGNRNNCALSNLAWVTRQENAAHREIHGTHNYGERSHNHKLTWEAVSFIRKNRYVIEQRALAEQFGVARSTIQRVQAGERWRPRI